MRRRDFIKVIGGGAAAWPLVVRAQQPDRMRRIGVLSGGPATDDPDNQTRWVTLTQTLQQLGWIEGRNLQIDYRLTEGNADRARKFAAELVALNPDVIVSSGTTAVQPLLPVTRTVPIVFVNVSDPVGAGLVDSLARPGGNATGFMAFEYSIGGKWLELLKQIAPGGTPAPIPRDPTQPARTRPFRAIQAAPPSPRGQGYPAHVRAAGQ